MMMKKRTYSILRNSWGYLLVFVLVLLFNLTNFKEANFGYFSIFLLLFVTTTFFVVAYILLAQALLRFFNSIFPREEQFSKKLIWSLSTLLLSGGPYLYGMMNAYTLIPGLQYVYPESAFIWNYFGMSIFNIALTFVLEGIHRYMEWKENLQETEKISAAYHQSRLNALKSQVNPHFLFNSLNTLSSLIQEDETTAETFLNELSKVYRYMLRNEEEQLVTLETEIRFLNSYQFLLETRYGKGLAIRNQIQPAQYDFLIAPLTLQAVIENAFTINVVSKNQPLEIIIRTDDRNQLRIEHNIQQKNSPSEWQEEEGLDNLLKKYRLLGTPVTVEDTGTQWRSISIPLLKKEAEPA